MQLLNLGLYGDVGKEAALESLKQELNSYLTTIKQEINSIQLSNLGISS